MASEWQQLLAGFVFHQVLELLLDAGGPVNARSSCGDVPLTMAAYGGHLSALRLLLAKGGEIEAAASDGATPLIAAAQVRRPTALTASAES